MEASATASQQDPLPKDTTPSTKCCIQKLPAELRIMIYDYVFSDFELMSSIDEHPKAEGYTWLHQLKLGLVRSCRLFQRETMEAYKIKLLQIWQDQCAWMRLSLLVWKDRHNAMSTNAGMNHYETATTDLGATDRLAWLIRQELYMMYRQKYILSFDISERIEQTLLDLQREYYGILFSEDGTFREFIQRERRAYIISQRHMREMMFRLRESGYMSQKDLDNEQRTWFMLEVEQISTLSYPYTVKEDHRAKFLFKREHPMCSCTEFLHS